MTLEELYKRREGIKKSLTTCEECDRHSLEVYLEEYERAIAYREYPKLIMIKEAAQKVVNAHDNIDEHWDAVEALEVLL